MLEHKEKSRKLRELKKYGKKVDFPSICHCTMHNNAFILPLHTFLLNVFILSLPHSSPLAHATHNDIGSAGDTTEEERGEEGSARCSEEVQKRQGREAIISKARRR